MGDAAVGSATDMMKLLAEELSSDWSFKQTDDTSQDAWLPVARVPSVVHQDLMDHKLYALKDPFIAFNEIDAGWVGERSWTYRRKLQRPSLAGKDSILVLAFDGLDTFAEIRLDDKLILKSDNMFLPLRIDVTEYLQDQEDHNLQISFDSALLRAREIEEKHPDHVWYGFNGETARLGVRKAQYHWGWDWGPVLMTAGIWRACRLEVYHARIDQLRTDTTLADDLQSASIKASVRLEQSDKSSTMTGLEAKFVLRLGGHQVEEKTVSFQSEWARIELSIEKPSLWYPAGYGPQKLYDLEVTLLCNGAEICSSSKRIGIRSAKLIQDLDQSGKSFYFRINSVDVFCGGSCWIPTDSLLPRVTADKYRSWIKLMVAGNQVMIRVWGGGIYENDEFYDACDELGIMVWQDFMFGCGNYPTFPSILESVRQEAVANLRRMRHHPSIVIYAGNNEDYQVQESKGLTYNYEDKNPDNWLKTNFPARYIYEKLLPEVMSEECPYVQYHPGSPWGDGKITSDPTVGDMHQWNVWHGTQEKYQIFDSLGGRFNSEFGMEAFPHIQTIEYFVTNKADLYPQSHVLDFHNKADGHERRIATYLVENVRTATDLKTFIHLTQLIQAEALMFGYRGWRQQYGKARHCGGALVWQLNDCWPTTSWAIVDYFLRQKPSYYAMARVLAPVAVGVRREHHDWSVTHARPAKTSKFELWAVSSLQKDTVATIELRFLSVKTGKEIKDSIMKKDVHVVKNGTTDVLDGVIDNVKEEAHVLAARIWVDGKLVARDMDWPQPLKYLAFPERDVKVKVDGSKMHVTVARPVKCLVFEEREGVSLSDSALDIAPGDEQVITVTGLRDGDEALGWTYLGHNEQ